MVNQMMCIANTKNMVVEGSTNSQVNSFSENASIEHGTDTTCRLLI